MNQTFMEKLFLAVKNSNALSFYHENSINNLKADKPSIGIISS